MAGEKKEEDFEDVGSQEGAVGGQLPMHALVETMLQTMQQTMQQQAALLKDMQVRQDRGEQRLMQFMQKFEPVLGKLEEKEEAGGATKMADTYEGDVHDSGLGVTSTTGVSMSMVSQLVSSPGNIEIAADPAVKPRSSLLLQTPLDSHRDMCNRVDGAIGIHAHAQSTPLITRGPRGRGRSPAGGEIGSPGSFFTDGLEYQNLDPAARHSRGGRGEVTSLNQPHNGPGEVSPTVPAMEGQSSGGGAIRSTAPDNSGPNQSRARPAQTPTPCCISTKLLAPFNGSEDWNVFVGPFERMARKKGWTDEERLDRLYERLRGPAVAFVMTLPENIREDYARLTEQLKQRFGKHIPTSTARRQLSELRQGKEASLGEFAEEVRRLVTLAYPTCTMELQDEFAAEAFLKGLRKPQVAYEVMNTDPKTLAEAQRLVEAREHNFKATVGRDCEGKGKIRRVSWEDEAKKGGTPVSTLPPGPQIPSEIQALVTDMAGVVKEIKRQLQFKHPDSNPKSEERGRTPVRAPGNASVSTRPSSPSPTTTTKGQCYQCGEVGHFKRNCSRSPSPGLAEKQVCRLSIKLPRAKGESPSLLVPITVNQLQLKCVIDTGAEATVMSQDTFQKLHLTDSPSGEPAYLLNAESGKEMGTVSKYSVAIKLGSKSRVWDVYVAPIRDPFLLGLDFILAANMTMLNGGQVLIEGEPVATTIVGRSVEDAKMDGNVVAPLNLGDLDLATDEFILDEVDIHIQANLEDDLVKEALKTGGDLRQCSKQVETELLRAQQRAYQAGDLVYVRDSTRKRGQSPKLQPPWKGPFLVTERIGPVLYRVQEKRGSRVLHHDRLLPCSSDVVPAWMRRQRHALLQEGGNEDLEGSPSSPGTSPNLQPSGTAPPDNISGDDRGMSEPLLNLNGTTHMSSTPTRRQTAARRRRGARRRPVSPSEPSSSEDEPGGALPQLTRRGRPVNRPARFRDD